MKVAPFQEVYDYLMSAPLVPLKGCIIPHKDCQLVLNTVGLKKTFQCIIRFVLALLRLQNANHYSNQPLLKNVMTQGHTELWFGLF